MEGYRTKTLGSKVKLAVAMLVAAFAAPACGGSIQTAASYDAQKCVESALRRGGDEATLPMAREKFSEECKSGDASACSTLGVMYEKGLGVEQSISRARELYDGACVAGNTHACVNYGKLIISGHGMSVGAPTSRLSPQEHAIRLFSMACRKDDARGCGELGRLLVRMGDVSRSTVLLRQGCEGGDGDSCFLLGSQYDNGALGNDVVSAMSFYEKACGKGHEKGCLHLDLIYAKVAGMRSGVAVALSPKGQCRAGQPCSSRVAKVRARRSARLQ